MSGSHFAAQDAAARMPRGVFLRGAFLAQVPRDDPYGYATVCLLTGQPGVSPQAGFEVLGLCPQHPQVAAVDCGCLPPAGRRSVVTTTPREVVNVDGAGGGWCVVCRGRLEFSWRVTFSDGTVEVRCSTHAPETREGR
jgi:hypothetical protein